MNLRILICCGIIGCFASLAGAAEIGFSGSNKTLGIASGYGSAAESWLINRHRLDSLMTFADGVSLRVILDNELYAGSRVADRAFDAFKNHRSAGPLDTSLSVIDGSGLYDRMNLYRLYISMNHKPFEITVGNQRVPLGRGMFYSPADYFNPLSPFAIEADREGIQGINGLYYVDYFSFFQVAAAYDDSWAARRTLIKYQTHAGEADIAFFIGNNDNGNVAGGDMAVNFLDGTIRWEGIYDDTDGNIQMVINYDRVYGDGWYVVTEFIYNRNGLRTQHEVRDVLSITPDSDRTGTAGTPVWDPLSRYYLGATISREVLTLMSASISTLVSLVDGSGYIGGSLAYNVLQNWDLEFSTSIFYGGSMTEYGLYPNVHALSLQHSF